MYLALLLLLIPTAIEFIRAIRFYCSSYHKITKNTYFATRYDKGKNGEYEIYRRLSSLEKQDCKFLFNLYLPKESEKTTEIDALLITKKGIVVFESKNFSGWIFGNESQRYWAQTLPQGKGKSRKEQFYNPVMQNDGHIAYLKKCLPDFDIPVFSVITFSERCTLKRITVNRNDVLVVKRDRIKNALQELFNRNPTVCTSEQINAIYTSLFPYSQSDQAIKKKHIESIKN